MKKKLNNKLRMNFFSFDIQHSTLDIRHSIVMVCLALLPLVTACSNKEAHEHDTYTCPMHPTVVSDRPGACPVCGMDLVRKARPGEEVKITEDLSGLLKSPNQVIVASVKTISAEYKSVPVLVEATGIVTYDTRKIYTIPVRAGGRIEKIYLKYEYQPVTKGQKVAEVYSPELITAQRELVYLLENDSVNRELIGAAKNKLQLLGLTEMQINDLAKRREVSNTVAIYSPYNGYVISEAVVPSTTASMSTSASTQEGGGMSGMGGVSSGSAQTSPATKSPGPSGLLLREGDYVSSGQTLFKVVNTDALRIELDLPGAQAGTITTGDGVELDFGTETEKATVDFVQPFFNEQQNFLKIRVYTNKVKSLQIGQLVRATIRLKATGSLWVPREAVLDLGTEKVIFMKERGAFKPKRITMGLSSGDSVEIKGGLASTDEIAANAQYLVDSESFIKPVN